MAVPASLLTLKYVDCDGIVHIQTFQTIRDRDVFIASHPHLLNNIVTTVSTADGPGPGPGGDVQTVAGVGPNVGGDVPALNLSNALIITGIFATAAQGAKADSALQDPTAFATAAQGDLADSAVQSVTGTMVDNTDPLNPVVRHDDDKTDYYPYNWTTLLSNIDHTLSFNASRFMFAFSTAFPTAVAGADDLLEMKFLTNGTPWGYTVRMLASTTPGDARVWITDEAGAALQDVYVNGAWAANFTINSSGGTPLINWDGSRRNLIFANVPDNRWQVSFATYTDDFLPVEQTINLSIVAIVDPAFLFRYFNPKVAGAVQLQSATTQIVKSDIALGFGKKLLVEESDGGTQHLLLDRDQWGVEVGNEEDPMILNTSNQNGEIIINWKDGSGTQQADVVAKVSDIPVVVDPGSATDTGQAADALATDRAIAAASLSGLVALYDFGVVSGSTPFPVAPSVYGFNFDPGEGWSGGTGYTLGAVQISIGGSPSVGATIDSVDGNGTIQSMYMPDGPTFYDDAAVITGGVANTGTGANFGVYSEGDENVLESKTLFLYATNQEYKYSIGSGWVPIGTPATPVNGNEYRILSWLDGTSETGILMKGRNGYSVMWDGVWRYVADADSTLTLDNETLKPRASDGAAEVSPIVFASIPEVLVKVAPNVSYTFRNFMTGAASVLNALISFASRAVGFATSEQGTKADSALQPLDPDNSVDFSTMSVGFLITSGSTVTVDSSKFVPGTGTATEVARCAIDSGYKVAVRDDGSVVILNPSDVVSTTIRTADGVITGAGFGGTVTGLTGDKSRLAGIIIAPKEQLVPGEFYGGKQVYQRMFIGNIVAGAGAAAWTALFAGVDQVWMERCTWQVGADGGRHNGVVATGAVASPLTSTLEVYVNETNYCSLNSRSGYDRVGSTNNQYKIVVKYTKV